MLISAVVYAQILSNFTPILLIQVVQAAAVITLVLNAVALWKQEARDPDRARASREPTRFREAWGQFTQGGRATRLLVAVGLGAAGFSMQEVLLEPFGGEVLGMSVSATSFLTAITAFGAILAFAWSARVLERGMDACRLAAIGTLIGVFAFGFILMSGPMESAFLLQVGSGFLGVGGGLFLVGTLTAAMDLQDTEGNGLAMGAWGAVQASAMGLAVLGGGFIRDVTTGLAESGALGPGVTGAGAGYMVVFQLEIIALFLAMAALGPLVAAGRGISAGSRRSSFGLAELPG
jgi:MFS transporter, BCD family, chlorophyll transporter